MSFYDNGVNLYVWIQFGVVVISTDSAILILKTIIGKEAAVTAYTSTTMEVHSDIKYNFN